jgi:hypothetical protein
VSEYPEHEKMHKVSEMSQKIGDFLVWLESTKRTYLMRWNDEVNDWRPERDSIEQILATYYEIDLDAIEREKQVMMKKMRELNK